MTRRTRPGKLPFPIREFEDRGTKWLLEPYENVRGLMLATAAELSSHLDFARMERVSSAFIPDTLRKQESDLIYRVPFKDPDSRAGRTRDVLVFLMVEHQSKPDPHIGFRVLYYMVLLWDRQRQEWQTRKTPRKHRLFSPIIPMVFYTGSRKWDTPISLSDCMDLPAGLKQFMPQFETLLLSLRDSSAEELTASGHPFGWLLRVIQKGRASRAELEKALDEAVGQLEGMAEEDQEAWIRAMYYLFMLVYHRRTAKEGEEIAAKLRESVGRVRGRGRGKEVLEMAQTLAEKLMEQGETKGRQEGRLESKQEDLLALMSEKFGTLPAEVVKRVRAIQDLETLHRCLIRVVHAVNLGEMEL